MVRALGAASASLALVVAMAMERPTAGSLGLGLLGILAFAVSRLFRKRVSPPPKRTAPVPQQARPEPAAAVIAGYGLLQTDDGTTLHPALTAGIQPSGR